MCQNRQVLLNWSWHTVRDRGFQGNINDQTLNKRTLTCCPGIAAAPNRRSLAPQTLSQNPASQTATRQQIQACRNRQALLCWLQHCPNDRTPDINCNPSP
jgi:hypothetical protein